MRIRKRSSCDSGSGKVPTWSRRVLRGDDEERLRAAGASRPRRSPGAPPSPRAARYCVLRRRAVDLVGEHDLREDRPGMELEAAAVAVVDRHAEDVGGQQVARELDALEVRGRATSPSACASVVLPTPGTSSISRWPRASRQASASRICVSLPRMMRPAALDHALDRRRHRGDAGLRPSGACVGKLVLVSGRMKYSWTASSPMTTACGTTWAPTTLNARRGWARSTISSSRPRSRRSSIARGPARHARAARARAFARVRARIRAARPTRGHGVPRPGHCDEPGDLQAALRAAGAAVLATDLVLRDKVESAFCSVRPPGHHADARARWASASSTTSPSPRATRCSAWPGARGDRRLRRPPRQRHRGHLRGRRQRPHGVHVPAPVLSLQRHRSPGAQHGERAAAGGTGSRDSAQVGREHWLPALNDFAPELIFFSAGFDAHVEDDMAMLRLVDHDYAWVTRRSRRWPTARGRADRIAARRRVCALGARPKRGAAHQSDGRTRLKALQYFTQGLGGTGFTRCSSKPPRARARGPPPGRSR